MKCFHCRGKGQNKKGNPCFFCEGTGLHLELCLDCNGSGYVDCDVCNGTGNIACPNPNCT